jgi:hypothetical protein
MKRASSSKSVRRHSARSPPTETSRSGATASVHCGGTAQIRASSKRSKRRFAGAVGSFTDAETPLSGIRVEWMSYSNKLLRGNRSACIPN